MLLHIENLREDYAGQHLTIENTTASPIDQFEDWLEAAINGKLPEPNAMTLATVRTDGRPAARIVLLKGFDPNGFVFYTNYESRKGEELAAHPFAALVFNWLELQRQVRIEGSIEKISAEESDRYFQSRPKGSQIGAWVSPQSKVIPNREVLEEKQALLDQQYADTSVLPRPENWGGFLLRPELIEFWQGQTSRLHDRIQYLKEGQNWIKARLAP
jgi:pyridoxamine 5'-phosphate oxidase